MPTPPVLFDRIFVPAVATGWGITALGAFLLLIAGIWWSLAGDGARLDPKPTAWRAINTAGWLLFASGIAWQLLGYYMIGALTWAS